MVWQRLNQKLEKAKEELSSLRASLTRESDDTAAAKARIYVDTKEAAMQEAGDILIPIENGVITAQDVQGDLADLCRGQVEGRGNDDEITLFKSVGTALEDLVAAKLLLD